MIFLRHNTAFATEARFWFVCFTCRRFLILRAWNTFLPFTMKKKLYYPLFLMPCWAQNNWTFSKSLSVTKTCKFSGFNLFYCAMCMHAYLKSYLWRILLNSDPFFVWYRLPLKRYKLIRCITTVEGFFASILLFICSTFWRMAWREKKYFYFSLSHYLINIHMLLLTVQQDSERKKVRPLACRGEWDSAIAGDHCASNYHCSLLQ